MATTYKTPGVYVEEIPKLPPSVAQVETAIPAFIGYTAKAERSGESLTGKPIRLNSLIEFVQYYGGDINPATINVKVDTANNHAVTEVSMANTERYFMYDSMRLFFDNGGGDCYIVSVGKLGTAPAAGDEVAGTGFRGGVKSLEKTDEPTIILFPDAANMVVSGSDDAGFYSLQQMVLDQCAKLQDRVGLFDIKENVTGGQKKGVENFRNNIGINNLKYAAAYTPWIYATYPREVEFTMFKSTVTAVSGGLSVDLGTLSADPVLNQLVADTNTSFSEIGKVDTVLNAVKKADPATGNLNGGAIPLSASFKDKFRDMKTAVDAATTSADAKAKMIILLNFCRLSLAEFQTLNTTLNNPSSLRSDVNSYAASESLWRGAAKSMILIDRNEDTRALSGLANGVAAVNALYASLDALWLGGAAADVVLPAIPKDYGDSAVDTNHAAIGRLVAIDLQIAFDKLSAFADTVLGAAKAYKKAAQDALYERHPVIASIVANIKREWNKLPPSGAIAGVYARVDNARGVWKAPANESLNSVSAPAVQITADEQSNLNVDAVAGKSINAIRSFTGKGTLVWGARTLMGNDNEWRYISVRRFFNMVEESCKKSTEPFVFEPNDANTWVKVQGMIENFLTVLWRQGALQGAKPEHAFYVAVGLGKTMTALDILEGRMVVEIGMAVVRPAEFIILKFSHKMAES
ncbi:MAG: phage tail sheath C-terminal domain-containing protein [Bacteroidota bacterium]